jgi:hypothetical protein
LQERFPETYFELMEVLGFERDLTLIAEMAQKLYQPDSDSAGVLIPQFDGYLTLENVPLQTRPRRSSNRPTSSWRFISSTKNIRWKRNPGTGNITKRAPSMAPA